VAVRTTVNLDNDVAAAVDRLRRERSIGVSEAVNELARAGLRAPKPRKRFRQRTYPIGLKIDVTNVAEALETAEGPDWR
jgi:Ribbon-helix-helix protein, copG family